MVDEIEGEMRCVSNHKTSYCKVQMFTYISVDTKNST